MVCPLDSGSFPKIFLKGAERYMEIILSFWKNYHSGQMGHVGPENDIILTELTLYGFFEILHSGRGQEVHGTYINGFCEKKF